MWICWKQMWKKTWNEQVLQNEENENGDGDSKLDEGCPSRQMTSQERYLKVP